MKRLVRLLKYLCMAAIWVAIILLLHAISSMSRERYDALKIEDVIINIADSTSNGNLVTTRMVKQMLINADIKCVGEQASTLPLMKIERAIAKNGFVESVRVYNDIKGNLFIDIEQRSALARLRINGYNSYITSSGFVFGAPNYTALYTSVITGSYKPFFPTNYTGNIDDYMLEEIGEIDLKIKEIEMEKYPIYMRERVNNEDKRDVRKRYINKRLFEDDDTFNQRVEKLREKNQADRRLYTYRQQVIDKELEAIDQRIERLREEQKKLQKSCEDIHNLITFVEIIESDPFWRSEVLQIEVTKGTQSQMRVALSVRSGSFKVTFGALNDETPWVQATRGELSTDVLLREEQEQERKMGILNHIIPNTVSSQSIQYGAIERERKREKREVTEAIHRKLDKLRDFYNDALPKVSWERYSEINIEFENQVVCKR